jgi:AraC family transcriptional activator of pobA
MIFRKGVYPFFPPAKWSIFSMPVTMVNLGLAGLLCFHPDLIRQTGLGKRIADYRFFSYQGNEALHLSDAEKFSITDLVRNIQKEYASRTDEYSYNLLVSQIELLLNYCQRYYGRQFLSRKPYEKSAVEDFFLYLNQCFDSNEAHCEGLPSVKDCALKLCYSPDYLSDLLRAETGMGAQEHIYRIFVHRAKDLLVSSEDRVNQIAYRLGFAYPQHFSRLFKMRTGLTPGQYRESVL